MSDMRVAARLGWLLAVGAAFLLVPRGVEGQTGPEPRLMFSLFGGVATGNSLFDIPVQPLSLIVATDMYDTLSLRRSITSAPTVGMNATLYGSSNFGMTAEIIYLGLRTDDTCEMLFAHADPAAINRQICDDITKRVRTISNVGITIGAAYRMAARTIFPARLPSRLTPQASRN